MKALWLRLRSVFRRRLDGDIDDEFRFHMEMAEQEFVESGMAPEQARLKVRQDFGNRTALKETGREMLTFNNLETLLQDVRYGAACC